MVFVAQVAAYQMSNKTLVHGKKTESRDVFVILGFLEVIAVNVSRNPQFSQYV